MAGRYGRRRRQGERHRPVPITETPAQIRTTPAGVGSPATVHAATAAMNPPVWIESNTTARPGRWRPMAMYACSRGPRRPGTPGEDARHRLRGPDGEQQHRGEGDGRDREGDPRRRPDQVAVGGQRVDAGRRAPDHVRLGHALAGHAQRDLECEVREGELANGVDVGHPGHADGEGEAAEAADPLVDGGEERRAAPVDGGPPWRPRRRRRTPRSRLVWRTRTSSDREVESPSAIARGEGDLGARWRREGSEELAAVVDGLALVALVDEDPPPEPRPATASAHRRPHGEVEDDAAVEPGPEEVGHLLLRSVAFESTPGTTCAGDDPRASRARRRRPAMSGLSRPTAQWAPAVRA